MGYFFCHSFHIIIHNLKKLEYFGTYLEKAGIQEAMVLDPTNLPIVTDTATIYYFDIK
ncbi:hypothetical protein [Aequorivita lipolytica]|uniref:hypothetical protein n=1 Tax=Aequorivita lipolytica TaxID=153267 RepID=UPI000DBBEB27|nr:hypothetical protein [Aequorivita lipolytica]SRX53313.1 hypothetical protein AEQU2_02543 [Aequorivita lipolytica]